MSCSISRWKRKGSPPEKATMRTPAMEAASAIARLAVSSGSFSRRSGPHEKPQ
jgi:hypothetical protein